MATKTECEFVSPDQLATIMGVSVQTIYRRLEDGSIRGHKGPGTNGRWRIHQVEVDKLRKADSARELRV